MPFPVEAALRAVLFAATETRLGQPPLKRTLLVRAFPQADQRRIL